MMKLVQFASALLLVTCMFWPQVFSQEFAPKKLSISTGTELHYVERGTGAPVVFIHGLLDDASVWSRQQQGFAKEGFRAIAYSRHHNYPNKNPIRPNHSAALEAKDLAAMVRKLKLGKVHVVGFSYGAYTALLFALEYPELAQSITLVEAPIAPWLSNLPAADKAAGLAQNARLLEQGIEPAQAALRSNNSIAAIRAMIDAIGGDGKYDSFPQFVKDKCHRNVSELRAFVASEDRYPEVDRAKVRELELPMLILSGGKSLATARFTDPELERLLPEKYCKRVIFADATHILWIEEPVRFRATVLDFLRDHPIAE